MTITFVEKQLGRRLKIHIFISLKFLKCNIKKSVDYKINYILFTFIKLLKKGRLSNLDMFYSIFIFLLMY